MINENHRKFSIEIFDQYSKNELISETYCLSDYPQDLPIHKWKNCIYILRIGQNKNKAPNLSNIANHGDEKGILYIGGHESGSITGRYNSLLWACRATEKHYKEHKSAQNDKKHNHTVANYLTTSLLENKFKIEDCKIDLVKSGNSFDELEMLIGYQERFHQLPPWNSVRKGISSYKNG
jgi:hypothetical protein